MITDTVIIRPLRQWAYEPCWHAMKKFTDQRSSETLDEIWLLEHPPVFTQGQNGKAEHILKHDNIPIVRSDRGGQVTYHGPGQLVAYVLVDMKRKKLNVRELVTQLEQSLIQMLAAFNISAYAKCEAPGVYINDEKIASLGLRIRRGCSYHGLSLNIAMDLQPYSYINPCGYTGLKMTQLIAHAPVPDMPALGLQLIEYLSANLGYTNYLLAYA